MVAISSGNCYSAWPYWKSANNACPISITGVDINGYHMVSVRSIMSMTFMAKN